MQLSYYTNWLGRFDKMWGPWSNSLLTVWPTWVPGRSQLYAVYFIWMLSEYILTKKISICNEYAVYLTQNILCWWVIMLYCNCTGVLMSVFFFFLSQIVTLKCFLGNRTSVRLLLSASQIGTFTLSIFPCEHGKKEPLFLTPTKKFQIAVPLRFKYDLPRFL